MPYREGHTPGSGRGVLHGEHAAGDVHGLQGRAAVDLGEVVGEVLGLDNK